MTEVNSFFREIKEDWTACYEKKNAHNQNRIVSIALRITGLFLLTVTTATFLAGLGVVAGSPFLALGLLLSTAALLVVSHDVIVLGNNYHDAVNPGINYLKDVAKQTFKDWRGREQSGAFYLRHTWIFKPIYSGVASCFPSR